VRALFPQRRSIAACPLSVFFSILHDPRAEWTLAPQQFLIHSIARRIRGKEKKIVSRGALKREFIRIFSLPNQIFKRTLQNVSFLLKNARGIGQFIFQ
jgi:hypothetical protein